MYAHEVKDSEVISIPEPNRQNFPQIHIQVYVIYTYVHTLCVICNMICKNLSTYTPTGRRRRETEREREWQGDSYQQVNFLKIQLSSETFMTSQ
jgi:hypothetical protein